MSAPTRHLLTAFDTLHRQTFGVPAVITGGRDARLLSDLWRSHAELIEPLMAQFFAEQDEWIASRTGFTVPGFKLRFAALLLAHHRSTKAQTVHDWREECQAMCGGVCDSAYTHGLFKLRNLEKRRA